MGGGEHEKKKKMGGRGFRGIGFHVDEELDSKHTCSRNCLLRTVLLIMIFFKGPTISQILRKYVIRATVFKLVSKPPAVYMHNFNRDLPKEWLRKLMLKTDGNSQPYFVTLSHCGFFDTVGIPLPEWGGWGGPLSFHFSLTTFLQGKQRLTNQSLLMLNPRNRHKKKILLHKHAYPYNNSCSLETPIQMKWN